MLRVRKQETDTAEIGVQCLTIIREKLLQNSDAEESVLRTEVEAAILFISAILNGTAAFLDTNPFAEWKKAYDALEVEELTRIFAKI